MADFEPIFARSASAVTPSEKGSVNTNRKSTTVLAARREQLILDLTRMKDAEISLTQAVVPV